MHEICRVKEVLFLARLPFQTPESRFGDKKSVTESVLLLYERGICFKVKELVLFRHKV